MRAITAVAIGFVLLFGFTLGSFYSIKSSARNLSIRIEKIETAIEDQKWEQAKSGLNATQTAWANTKSWWSILIDHQELDNIDISMQRLEKYVATKGTTLSLGETSTLVMLFDHIAEKEAPSFNNIL